ncbi:hypothetical protein B6254_0796 [Weissella cibaria]|uniref:Uncharacterized protein n=1 Tax=Weissella cibaria TaxID=137591 RepID=A0A2S1KQK9_9LACO|nr:hypothetical protein B6254_0796 [Weissella cibaria]
MTVVSTALVVAVSMKNLRLNLRRRMSGISLLIGLKQLVVKLD